jgi:hypothetical protein
VTDASKTNNQIHQKCSATGSFIMTLKIEGDGQNMLNVDFSVEK